MTRLFGFAIVSVVLTVQAQASVLNGTFDDGLNGWTASATALNPANDPPSVDPFVNIADNTGDPFARLLTPERLNSPVVFSSLSQVFTVSASATVLSFDFGRVLDVANPDPSDGLVSIDDEFRVVLVDVNAPQSINDTGFYTLVNTSGDDPVALGDRQRTRAGLNVPDALQTLTVNTSASSDPLLDATVTVDLAALIGLDVELRFVLEEEFDGRQTGYGVDNVAMSGTTPAPPAVPLPATAWLMLAGLGALGVARKRRRS